MKQLGLFFTIVALAACSQNDDQTIRHLIGEYQGCWCNLINANDESYMERLVITGNDMEYVLTNTTSNIVYEKQVGSIISGNENKIVWNCRSLINNTQCLTTWDVLSLSENMMRLYSDRLGEHTYLKYSTPNKFEVSDTLAEMFQFNNNLPLSRKDIGEMYGTYNQIMSDSSMSLSYLLSHPLFSKVEFKENYESDSIYTYALSIKDWISCKQIVDSLYILIRHVNSKAEYCDAESLGKSSNVIIVDSTKSQMTFSPIRDYDYWPNVSHFIGVTIQDVKKKYENKYVYEYHHSKEDGLNEYQFYTKHGGICEYLGVAADDEGVVRRSWVTILGKYSEEQKNEILHLLESKYLYREDDTETYYYRSKSSKSNTPFEVKYEASKRKITFINN